MDDSGDEVEMVSVTTQEIQAKLLEVRKYVPFIRSVRKSHENTLSKVQSQRLQALIGLLERENVSILTLNKIERIVNKLKKKFSPRFSDVIDISEQNSRDSNDSPPCTSSGTAAKSSDAATAKSATPKPSDAPKAADQKTTTKKTQGSKPTNASDKLPSPGDTKPSPKESPAPGVPPRSPAESASGGVLAAMQEARSKEMNSRCSSPSGASSPSKSTKDSGAMPAPKEEFTRRAYTSSMSSPESPSPAPESPPPAPVSPASPPQFTRRSTVGAAAKKGPSLSPPQFSRRLPNANAPKAGHSADKPDFVRRSTPLVQDDKPSPEKDNNNIPRQPSTPSPIRALTNSLEEARKKLAALRATTGQEQPALASNMNDPRGKKHQFSVVQPQQGHANRNITPPPMVRIPSPIPPAPSMKPNSSWSTYASIPMGSSGSSQQSPHFPEDHSPMGRAYGRDSGVDSWRSRDARESRDMRDSRSDSRDPRDSRSDSRGPRDIRSDSRDPRDSRSDSRDPRDSRSDSRDPRDSRSDSRDPRDSRSDSRDPRDSRSDSRDPRDARESRSEIRDPRDPRDPRMGRNQSSHGQQQHQSHKPPSYSGDPRRAPGTYAYNHNNNNNDESSNWQTNNNNNNSNENGNGNGNMNGTGSKYTKPNWGSNPSGGNANNIPVMGFKGSASFRGGFRGGNHNRGGGVGANPNMGRYGRPNAGPAANGAVPEAGPNHVPRTYREHREAKARAEAAVKAKLAEELRLLEAEKQRLLEAVEKESLQADNDKEETEAAVPELQLDTLYRNPTGPSAKKIDFRIPKKAPTVASSPSCDGEGDVSSPPASKACDAKKDKDKDSDKHNDKASDKDRKDKDKAKDRGKEKSESKKHHKADKEKGRSSSASSKEKRLEKDKEKKTSSSSRDYLDTESVISMASSENTENLENEPPVAAELASAPAPPDSQLSADEELEAMAKLRGGKTSININGDVAEKDKESEDTIGVPEEVKADEDKPPKLSKIKIVLGPNAHSLLLLHPDKSSPVDPPKALANDNKLPLELFVDEHDDTEVPGPPMHELRRIMQRRNSMVPKGSKPLVDKAELLTGCSLTYEDLQEQKRQTQRARTLANMFENTSDNCRISTQNIITGKRRTRGGGLESCFNETQLSRNTFGLSTYKRSEGARPKTGSDATLSESSASSEAVTGASRKRRRNAAQTQSVAKKIRLDLPENEESQSSIKEDIPEIGESLSNIKVDIPQNEDSLSSVKDIKDLPLEQVNVDVGELDVGRQQPLQPPPTRKPRKPKRNELDKLNEDIAMMYYGDDVLRATGRRACTQRSRTPSVPRVSPTPEESISSRSSRMSSPLIIRNVARRGKRFIGPSSLNGGLTRATFQAKTKRLQVRITRSAALTKMIKEAAEGQEKAAEGQEKAAEVQETAKRRKRKQKSDVRNVNPDWDSASAALAKCVVCHANIRKSPLIHYIQKHGEHFASRLPPGMLDELRAGRGSQRPDYWMLTSHYHVYRYKCPFCVKVINMRSQNLAQHILNHTGERRYQCSHCKLPLHRMHILQEHLRTCGPGATAISHPDCALLPISLHVCHLCQFVQVSREHMDHHLVEQHGMKEDEVAGLEHEQVVLCTLEDVPKAATLAEAQEILKRNENRSSSDTSSDPKPKATTADPKSKATAAKGRAKAKSKARATSKARETASEDDDDERPSTSKAAQKKAPKKKVNFRFQKMAKKSIRRIKREREEQTKEQEEEEQDKTAEEQRPPVETTPQASSEASTVIQTKMEELPLPPPEKETLLVVNECLMDQDMEMELEELAEEEQALQNKDQSMLVDEKPTVLMDVDEADVDVEASTDETPVGTANPVLKESPAAAAASSSKTRNLLAQELSLSELDAKLLDGIGSDASDGDVDVDVDVEGDIDSVFGDDNVLDEPMTDEWIDLETAERNRKSTKNPFQAFTRFCSRRSKGSTKSGRSWPSNTSNSGSEGSNDAPPPDPSELMPRMRPLEPETTTKTPQQASLDRAAAVTPSPATTATSTPVRKTPLKRVENVAYRKWSSANGAAYYCIYPGCTFLFSNELEGLENHFARDHPTVRWSGACAICPRTRRSGDGQQHGIAEELRHLTEVHMKEFSVVSSAQPVTTTPLVMPDAAPEVAPDPAPEPPAAPLFKLRVRRFTGDRLAEPLPAEESQPAGAGVAAGAVAGAAAGAVAGAAAGAAPATAAGGVDQPNGMLRVLLQADPRPPNQVDFNAAGLGEFLCAKPTTPPVDGTSTAADQPVVINYPSGLALAISQVFNGASVPMPVLENSPSAQAPPPAPAPAPVPEESRLRLVADRFRCMAVNCGFCAHTVMCIREHMKFHRFSFGCTGYLNCAYCDHVAADVDDYLRHGVLVHSLAPKSDLAGALESPSVSQQIRDMLNQRGSVTIRSIPTTAAASDSTLDDATPVVATTNAGAAAGAGGSAGPGVPDVSLATAVTELLRPTGYSEDKLYACPHKGCIVRLTDEQFVNHVRYHIRSTLNQGSEQVKCKYCSQTLLPPSLRTHLQQSHARHKLFCSICLATAANKRLMLYHVRNQHPQAFELVNRHLQFIQLPTDSDVGAGKGAAGATSASEVNEVFLAAVVQPFGKQEMEIFRRQLLEELQLRRLGTKAVYRGSEVRLLPRNVVFPHPIHCGECSYSTIVRCMLQKHLYDHKEKVVREAYQTEEETRESFDAAVAAAAAAANERAGDAATAVAAAAAVTNPAASDGDEGETRAPGKHKPVVPRYKYVPKELRYRCGFVGCLQLLASDLDLRQHMTQKHCYSEFMYCHHCNGPQQGQMSQTSVDKYMAHLLMHKRHIYQCGGCVRYNNKLSMIERHIQDRHPLQEVDVVMHRHSDSHLTTTARWLKARKTQTAPYPSQPTKAVRPIQMEFVCNLCHLSLPTAVQIMAHAVAVHSRKYQFHCPYCSVGDKDASEVIEHIIVSHGGRRVQPVQIYQRIAYKKGQTLGFYCLVCQKSANSLQKIGQHCEEMHKSRYQWQCPHCDFGNHQERVVAQHIDLNHVQKTGLAVMQFERVSNDIPDTLTWDMGQPIAEEVAIAYLESEGEGEEEQKQQEKQQEKQQQQKQQPAPKQAEDQQPQPKQAQHIVTEVVDLLGSDDETEGHESGESQEDLKIIEFACTHCGETNSNLQDLRTQHWAHVHPDQPFYFRVQPQLLCSECKRYKSNAKTLRDEHLLKVHSIRNIVACDVRRPEECAYCDYKYQNWRDLAQHISREGHLPNDLKNVTDEELAALQQLSASGGGSSSENEYYQCDLCSVVMPTKGAIGQHGRVEHSKPGERFCFRQLTAPLIYHCFFCMFTSADELTTLRHMVDHYNRFLYCHFCARHLPGGFDEYIQHCYSFHREDVHRFRALHSYADLRKFLMNVHYQFQNGLIITKSSLRRTRFNDERVMRMLDSELMAKAQRPPIRLHISLKSKASGQAVQVPVQEPPTTRPLAQITKRRKTLNPDELLRSSRQDQQQQQQQQPPQQQPQPPQQQTQQSQQSPLSPKVPRTRIVTPLANRITIANVPAPAPSTSAGAASAAAAAPPAAVNMLRIVKRRNSYVVRTGP